MSKAVREAAALAHIALDEVERLRAENHLLKELEAAARGYIIANQTGDDDCVSDYWRALVRAIYYIDKGRKVMTAPVRAADELFDEGGE